MKKPFNKKPTVFAFIDSQNLNLGTQKAGWKLDWRKFRDYLQVEHNVSRAYLFIGYMQEHEDMYNQLHGLGYLIVLKPTIDVSTVTEEGKEAKKPIIKGNIDAELVLYAMKEMPNYHEAIIVSGDGDFYCLAEYLADKKRLKAVMTPNRQYSSLLKPYEQYIIRVDQLRGQLEHYDRSKKFKKPQDKSST